MNDVQINERLLNVILKIELFIAFLILDTIQNKNKNK